MNRDDVEAWLARYGRAWEAKDASGFTRLFSPDVAYHWTPFDAPNRGRDELTEAFDGAVSRQEDIAFGARVLSVDGPEALAHWWCSFVRADSARVVRLEGIFLMKFDAAHECVLFREWWHSDEPASP